MDITGLHVQTTRDGALDLRFLNPILMPFFIFLYAVARPFAAIDRELPEGWASQNGGTTGGMGGPVDTVAALTDLNGALSGTEKRVVFLKGNITGNVILGSNKTLIGFPGSSIRGSIIGEGRKNIILRNLKVSLPPCGASYDSCKNGSDAVHFTGTTNVWADHLDLSDGQDGIFDITHVCDYFTITYCKFYYTYANPHNRSNLFGSADGLAEDIGHYKTTFQYCWWTKGVGTRMPRTRYGDVHIVNNLYDSDVSSYCITVGAEARCLIEGNAFYGVKDPINDGGGIGLARNNLFVKTSGNTATAGGAFTPPYALTILPADKVQAVVQAGAGQTLDFHAAPSATIAFNAAPAKAHAYFYEPSQTVLRISVPGKNGLESGVFDLKGKSIFLINQGKAVSINNIYN